MHRRLAVVAVALVPLLVAAGRHRAPQPCTLLTQQDASTLMGFPVALDAELTEKGSCAYNTPAAGPLELPKGVELHLIEMPSASAAHARYPSFLSAARTVTVTPAPGVGDEANYRRSPASVDINSIVFRKGAVLISIGTHPIVSDAALKIAANKMITRL
jgi:hypothetical protein